MECGDWKRGKCYRGASCRYIHDGARTLARRSPVTADGICADFKAGTCYRNASCKYSHEIPGQEQSKPALPEGVPVPSGGAARSATPASQLQGPYTDAQGRRYFYNTVTMECQWMDETQPEPARAQPVFPLASAAAAQPAAYDPTQLAALASAAQQAPGQLTSSLSALAGTSALGQQPDALRFLQPPLAAAQPQFPSASLQQPGGNAALIAQILAAQSASAGTPGSSTSHLAQLLAPLMNGAQAHQQQPSPLLQLPLLQQQPVLVQPPALGATIGATDDLPPDAFVKWDDMPATAASGATARGRSRSPRRR
eukprot:TRINITY_DN13183_c0_g1_i1.p1 TRINITY_DN13183_c0_g1~~TRINITY_DN13183_c0_g1_i1.p1  ORF type:complete len:311 (-),score=61.77 TRINITY_DN13183_c0_g1_i1:76-1008(-)